MGMKKLNRNAAAISGVMGNVLERYKYDGFGRRTVLSADAVVEKPSSEYDWNRAFTGQVLDSETGMMQYRMRYYHSTLGRFVNRDPIGYEANDNNLYRYVLNQSIRLTDLYGLKKCGPRVWVYTGSWCVEDNVWDAAMDAAGQTPGIQCSAIISKILVQVSQLAMQYVNTGSGFPDVFPLHSRSCCR
jgi:RHS repeat-associated protein